MAEKPLSKVDLRDYPGLMSRPDPTDLPLGAGVVQVNLQSSREGALESRPGLSDVVFEEE